MRSINRFSNHHRDHYPIIISLENHATDTNRIKLFNVLFNIFKEKLFLTYKQDAN